MDLRYIVLIIFGLIYGFFIVSAHHRAKAMWIGIGLMVILGYLFQDERLYVQTLFVNVNWNVLGVLMGAMLIADLFIESRVPVLLADLIADRCKTAHMAMLGVCALSGAISMVADNVTTVLLVSPVALAITRRTGLNPVALLIGIAISANLQGAATLIGDPPSMLLAGHFRMGFNDFFIYQGRPSIFFAIQAGAVFGLLVLWTIFRRHKHCMEPVPVERPKTWVPVGFIAVMIAFLASSSHWDPGFVWLAGTGNIILGAVALLWAVQHDRVSAWQTVKRYEYPTIAFLTGIFVLAYTMNAFGWVKAIGDLISGLVGNNQFLAYTIIVWVSVIISAFVDNIAYVAVMLPVTQVLSQTIGGHSFLYAAGLLIGACLGGNITPIGASCNVVAMGMLRREGHAVSFWQFAKVGLPFTLAATTAGYVFIWLFWGT